MHGRAGGGGDLRDQDNLLHELQFSDHQPHCGGRRPRQSPAGENFSNGSEAKQVPYASNGGRAFLKNRQHSSHPLRPPNALSAHARYTSRRTLLTRSIIYPCFSFLIRFRTSKLEMCENGCVRGPKFHSRHSHHTERGWAAAARHEFGARNHESMPKY